MSTSETTEDPESSSGSTAGPAPACGNGIVEDGEHCDGNTVVGVPCPTDCVWNAGEELWKHELPYYGESDRPQAIVFPDDDSFYLAGAAFAADDLATARPGYVAYYNVDGALQWGTRPAERYGPGYAELAQIGDQLVVSGTGYQDTQHVLVVHGLSPGDGSLIWTDEVLGEWPLNEIYPGSVLEAPSGNAWVAYAESYMSPDMVHSGTGTLIEYDTTGFPLETVQIKPPYVKGEAEGFHIAPWVRRALDGAVTAGTSQVPEAFVQRRDSELGIAWEYRKQIRRGRLTHLEILEESPSVLVRDMSENTATLLTLTPDGEEAWSVLLSDDNPNPNGLAIADDGSIFVVFGIEYDSAHRTIFTHKYAPDGTRVWEDAYTPDNSATPWIYVTDLALSPSGAVVMVGYIGGPKTTYRGFVRAVAQ